jgi:hypothetical protein
MKSQTAPAYRSELQRILREDVPRYMTQGWLSEQVGVHESYISRIVNGLHCPDDLKHRIADALGREIGEVFPA